MRTACTALLLLLAGASAQAQSSGVGDELARAAGRDSEVTVHLRSYYLNRQNPSAADSEAWAGGGWLGYQSGWFADVVRLGAVGYTSQPIWAPKDKDGTLLLAPGQKGYSVVGQAYVGLKLWDQVFTAYRQSVDQPEVNAQDNRMTPNTFQGYTLSGKVGTVEYFGGYLDRMKKRNADSFVDLAVAAGAPAGSSEPMWLLGFEATPQKDLMFRLSGFRVPNVLGSVYADGSWLTPLSADFKLRVGAQYMRQSSNGSDLLTGSSFDTWSGGVRFDLLRGPATLALAYNQTGRGAAYRAPYGSWAGYTSMIVKDFDRAGETAWLIGGTYDFAGLNVPGLAINAAAVFGRRAIDAATGASLSNNEEYDFTIDYRFKAETWPAWARPLWIRARAVRVEEKLASVTSVTNDYRVIVNYEWVFK